MYYRNLSNSAKTFYGVTFPPGETREVPSTINHKDMLRVSVPEVEIVDKKSVKASKKANTAPIVKSDTSSDKPQSDSKTTDDVDKAIENKEE